MDGTRAQLAWGAKLARLVLRHRLLFGVAWCAISVAFAFAAATKLQVRAGIEQMIEDGAQSAHDSAQGLRAPGELAVLVQGHVFQRDFLTRLARLERDLAALQRADLAADADSPTSMFERSRSLLSVPRLEFEGDSMRSSTLSELVDTDLGQVQRIAMSDPSIARRFVDTRGEVAMILLQGPVLDDNATLAAQHAIDQVVARYDRPGFRVSVAGLSVLKALIATILYSDISRLFALSIAASLAMLLFAFRSPLAVLGPGLVIGATSAWAFGAMAYCGVPLTIIGLYLPAFLTVVAIGDSIHLQSTYRSLHRAGRSNTDAIIEACGVSAAPVLYTTVTTCVGLLGLRVARIEAIRDLGTFGAFGLAAAWLHTVIVIPIVLSLHRGAPMAGHASQKRDWLEQMIARISRLSHPSHGGTGRWIALACLLTLLSAFGMSRLRVHHEMIEWLPTGNRLAPAVELLDQRLGGSATMSVLIDFKQPRALFQYDTLQRLARIEQRVLAYGDPEIGPHPVLDVNSALDVVRAVWRATRSPNAAAQALPMDSQSADAAFQLIDLFATRELNVYANADGSQTRVDLRMPWTDAGSYGRTLEYVRRVVDAELGATVRASISGPVADMNRAVNSLLGDLINSFAASCAGIVLTLVLFLRDLRLSLLAMLPNLFPIALVLGAMGFFGFPVDVHTLLLSSVLEGVIVDDTIHFLHHFRDRYAVTGDVDDSIEYTFQQSGSALVITNLTLALGFLTCLAASMHHMQRMSLLLSFTIVLALLVELVLSPALLRRYGPRLLTKRAAPPAESLAANST